MLLWALGLALVSETVILPSWSWYSSILEFSSAFVGLWTDHVSFVRLCFHALFLWVLVIELVEGEASVLLSHPHFNVNTSLVYVELLES